MDVTECGECGADVEISEELDADAMREAGWHHDDDCPGPELARSVRELHHQAHGPADITRCRSTPCLYLTASQLTGQTPDH